MTKRIYADSYDLHSHASKLVNTLEAFVLRLWRKQ